MELDLRQLIAKLNGTAKRTLEMAAGLCQTRTNYNVEIEHWMLRMLDEPRCDFNLLVRHGGIDSIRLQRALTKAIDRLRRGNSRFPALSENLVSWIRVAWPLASLKLGSAEIRTGHLVVALLSDKWLRSLLDSEVEVALKNLSPDDLLARFGELTDGSEENPPQPSVTQPEETGEPVVTPRAGDASRTPNLDQFTTNLTARAKSGQIDPVLGRDTEIRQVIDILCRRRQNNPILTGEAGVGKTAVAEGFALRIAAGDVPPPLLDVHLHTLDLGLLQAGAGVKGEFEARLKGVIDEVRASVKPIILFIDEAHTLIGAGGSGAGDAANLLKPALARGELRTIAATTWAEYKKYFEKDAALTRRFQVVRVEEPSEHDAIEMMRGLAETLERHHGVEILSSAIEDAVRLSKRYISGRQLPDKSVSLLDTTCARISLSQHSTPAAVEDCRHRLQQNEVTRGILEREQQTGTDHFSRLSELSAEAALLAGNLAALEGRWQREKELVGRVRELRKELRPSESQSAPEGSSASGATAASAPTPPRAPKEIQAELQKIEAELKALQGEMPLVHPYVHAQAVAETVESWTGIPVGRMVADEVDTVLRLKELLEETIVGQSHAMERIAESVRTSRAGLTDPRTPIGVFLLVGTSGVGKTETAISLADLLYGGEQNMTVINMSEFKEEHKVSLLMGSPPGYVGYGEGGVLTEAVRRKPYSVVLLDEMEKAHPGVQDIFYQVFDKGQLRDGEGRDIDFRNTLILMTSNAGTDLIKKLCSDPETAPDPEAFTAAVFPELLKTFKPAFLGRCMIIPYYPLGDDVLRRIIRLKLGKIGRRVAETHRATFDYSAELVDAIALRCTEVDTGARNIDHILKRSMLPELSSRFLGRIAAGESISRVHVGLSADGDFEYQLS